MHEFMVNIGYQDDIFAKPKTSYKGGIPWFDDFLKGVNNTPKTARGFFPNNIADVTISLANDVISFEVFLNEWLEHLTHFLKLCKIEASVIYKEQQLIAGGWFEAKALSNKVSINIFTHDHKDKELTLSFDDTVKLHKALRAYLFEQMDKFNITLGREIFEITEKG